MRYTADMGSLDDRSNSQENSKGIKTFVIDTNVLIHYPEAVMSFRDNEIVIPLEVLEELDDLKTYPDQRGKSAREAIRFLDTVARKGNLNEGVRLENGSTLKVSLILPDKTPAGVFCQADFPDFATKASRKTPRGIPGFRHREYSRVT